MAAIKLFKTSYRPIVTNLFLFYSYCRYLNCAIIIDLNGAETILGVFK